MAYNKGRGMVVGGVLICAVHAGRKRPRRPGLMSTSTGAPEAAVREFDAALERFDERLFEEWDRIAEKHGLDSRVMKALLAERVDTAEAYGEWIDEAWEVSR